MKQKELDNLCMDIALRISKESKAKRLKVGAVLYKDDAIISFGYNGTPTGRDNCCEYLDEHGDIHTKPEVMHAEANAILKCAKHGRSTNGATLYIVYSPCIECSKLVIQSGISRVVFLDYYRDTSGLDLLKDAGIEYEKLDR